jgi:tripartite-type tricarboxylate transporter receptor subunit TctC
MNTSLTKRLLVRMVGAAMAVASVGAQAQSDRPIRMIVPLAAGSTVDAVARALAPSFGRTTGHAVVVENIAGAGGIPGTSQLVKASKDGLTVGMISSNHVINPGIYKTVPYDSLKDITPIAVLATVPLALVVNAKLPVKSVQDLLAHAKSHPGTLNYGSAGNGSTLHLAAELMISETGIDMKHVPYRGTGPLITDLVGGQVQLGFVSVSQVTPQVKAGTLRALAISTSTRSTALPDVPTMAEAGVPNVEVTSWQAIVAPKGLPPAVREKAHAAFVEALNSPKVKDQFTGIGFEMVTNTPAEFAAFQQKEYARWKKVIEAGKISIE